MTENPFDTLSLEHTSTVDRVVEELRRALFEGDIEAGTPLREVALAEAMRVSRSTVREALSVLVGEGLATREPNRGVHVTAPGADSIRDVCRARVVLETAGVRRWPEASDAARDEVRDALVAFAGADQVTPAEMTAAHLAVHRSFVGLLESERLTAQADALFAEVRLSLAHVDRVRRNHGEQVRSHRALLGLLERGRAEDAARELAHHLEDGATSMLGALGLDAG